ncbi:hypothetical protein J7E83_13190 [Arthrobacter sp. ISL-48]|uniref:hypothetical protein n=1 Tax=Arthrobacter sp. ISL-48 TaxID=2819110 RepID=UPI001BEA5AB8|nr:hypothetical protein [Arthrobacter sp. ISL-48]MBT2533058.1 hypothetical protein [Arthrobacter sp. ISL-48]
MLEVDGLLKLIPETVHLQGTVASGLGIPVVSSAGPEKAGGATTIHTEHLDLSVSRELDLGGRTSGHKILTATWTGQAVPVQLASAVEV